MSLWHGEEGTAKVRFFFPGRYFKEPVQINVVEGGQAKELLFSQDMFEIPEDSPARKLSKAGFAGFRVMDPEEENDWLAVLGASYFRTSGYSGQFGMSARGLAINSGGPGPEEFPRFSRFWLEQGPAGGIVIYALLEGPRVTGAYRMATARNNGVFQDIDASLYLRGDVERLGIAPLTSMFWYGKHNHFLGPDWRPEIHDSDGLEMYLGNGERIWRPLNNPPWVMVNSFRADGLKGFGLAQRERSFEEYQDDGVFYEKRATVWVEPRGDWGEGSVMLVELPTNDEIHDNIGAFWNPLAPATAGTAYDLSYKVSWVEDSPPIPIAKFIATRIGAGGVPGQPRPANVVKFVLDLDGKGLEGLDRVERRRGGGEREPGGGVAGLCLPDRDDRPLAGDLRPRHRRAGGAAGPDRPQALPEARGRGEVGDVDLPGLPVAAARPASPARLKGLRGILCPTQGENWPVSHACETGQPVVKTE